MSTIEQIFKSNHHDFGAFPWTLLCRFCLHWHNSSLYKVGIYSIRVTLVFIYLPLISSSASRSSPPRLHPPPLAFHAIISFLWRRIRIQALSLTIPPLFLVVLEHHRRCPGCTITSDWHTSDIPSTLAFMSWVLPKSSSSTRSS